MCVPIEILSTYFNLPCVCVHKDIVNLPQPSVMLIQCVPTEIVKPLQPASTQGDVDPLRVPSSYCQSTSTCLNQCDVDPVCAFIELLSTYFNLPQSYCQPTSTCLNLCNANPVCVPIELLSTTSTYLNQCPIDLVCVPIEQ